MNDSYLIYSFFMHNLACFIQNPFKLHSWFFFFSSMVHMQDISASCKFRTLKGICFISISCMRHVIPVSYTKRGFMYGSCSLNTCFVYEKGMHDSCLFHIRVVPLSCMRRSCILHVHIMYASYSIHVCYSCMVHTCFIHETYREMFDSSYMKNDIFIHNPYTNPYMTFMYESYTNFCIRLMYERSVWVTTFISQTFNQQAP